MNVADRCMHCVKAVDALDNPLLISAPYAYPGDFGQSSVAVLWPNELMSGILLLFSLLTEFISLGPTVLSVMHY